MRERAPVGVLKRRLLNLQADVAAAHERLHNTEVGTLLREEHRVSVRVPPTHQDVLNSGLVDLGPADYTPLSGDSLACPAGSPR